MFESEEAEKDEDAVDGRASQEDGVATSEFASNGEEEEESSGLAAPWLAAQEASWKRRKSAGDSTVGLFELEDEEEEDGET